MRMRTLGVALSGSLILMACSSSDDDSSPADDAPPSSDAELVDVRELTIADIRTRLLDGELSCAQLVESYLARVHSLDQDLAGGWPINSVLRVNENVRTEAAALDASLARTGELGGALHCVPILLKDNFDTADMPTTAASLTMLGAQPTSDATTVARIREAGAVLLGKATMDAWAMGAGGASSRPRAGSPYDTAFLTSSSSSGPAAAVAANLALAATGSDTCGSLTSPGSANGVVAIRGSYGLAPQTGIVPLAHSHDVPGPMARTVTDAATLLSVMAGADPADPTTFADPEAVRHADYTDFLDPDGVAGKRIGVLRLVGEDSATPEDEPESEAIATAIERLSGLGADIVDPIDFAGFDGTYLADYEADDDLDAYFASHDTPLADVQALAADPLVHPNVRARLVDRVFPQIDTDDPDYLALVENNADVARRFAELMDAENLDALVLQGGNACVLSVTTGIPYMVVPVSGDRGDDDPRPVGLGIMTRKWDEPTMLEIAFGFENARGPRKVPVVASSLDDDTVLPDLVPETYNACVEDIALAARELQGDDFEDITPEQYLGYVQAAGCTLETHRAAGIE